MNLIKKYFLRINIFIGLALIVISNISTAAAEKNNELKIDDYDNFKKIVETLNDSNALLMGDTLFGQLAEKYENNTDFSVLKSKLASAEYLTQQMMLQFKNFLNQQLITVSDEVFKKDNKGNSSYIASAKELYDTSYELFSKPINISNLTGKEKTFLTEYYNLKLKIFTGLVAKAGQALAITDSSFNGLYEYVLILPLLHTPLDKPVNISMFPLWMQKSNQLDKLSEACLLKFGLPFQAMLLAQKSAEINNQKFSQIDFYKIAAQKCGKDSPHIAADCLRKAIECIQENNYEDRITLQFQIVQIWIDTANYALAAADSQKIFETYPNDNQIGKAFWIYYYSLSKSNNVDKILFDIDKTLGNEHCEPYKARLMYIKWWALRHKSDQSAKIAALEHDMLNQFSDDPLIAPVLLSRSTDFLANQDYKRARELLIQLIEKFPLSNAAGQAQTILTKLESIQ